MRDIGKYDIDGFTQTGDINGQKFPVWILNHEEVRGSISQGEETKKYYVFVTIPGRPRLLLNSYKNIETASKKLKEYVKKEGY